MARLAVHLGMTAFSVFLLSEAIHEFSFETVMALLSVLTFGSFAVVFAAALLTRAAWIRLDDKGFEIGLAFGRRARARWENVSNFRVRISDDAARERDVAFDITSAGAIERDVLLGNYQLAKHDLAMLMNEWRKRSLALPRKPTSVPRVGGWQAS